MSLVLALKSFLPGKPDNEVLMTQYRLSQESRYLEMLYDNCGNDLYHFILSQSDAELAQEICQRTWIKVMEKRNTYKSHGRFQSWLFTIARNLLMDEFRRQSRLCFEEELQLVDETASVESELTSNFDEALSQLPFLQKEALVLQLEGFGLTEIAEITQCDRETVKSRLRYAKTKLKQLWRSKHV